MDMETHPPPHTPISLWALVSQSYTVRNQSTDNHPSLTSSSASSSTSLVFQFLYPTRYQPSVATAQPSPVPDPSKPSPGFSPRLGPSPRLPPALGPVLESTKPPPVVPAASSAHWAPRQGLGCWGLRVQLSFGVGTAPLSLEVRSQHCLG